MVEGLLTEAAGLLRARREHREATGEGYNFFTALCAHHDENRHSHFLHSLLNPHGAHGQGALFLRLFLVELGLVAETDGQPWRWQAWRVKTEVTFDDGRRIDLLLVGPGALEAVCGVLGHGRSAAAGWNAAGYHRLQAEAGAGAARPCHP